MCRNRFHPESGRYGAGAGTFRHPASNRWYGRDYREHILRQKKRQPVVEADCQGGVKCGTEKVGGAKHRGKKEDEKTWTPAIPWPRWLNCNHQRAGMSTTGTGYPPMGGGGAKKEGTIPRDRPQKRGSSRFSVGLRSDRRDGDELNQ